MHWAAIAYLLVTAPMDERGPLPAPTDHHPAHSWATTGWGSFRWGMGLGDVLDAPSSPKGPFRVHHGFACDYEPTFSDLDDVRERGVAWAITESDSAECWVLPESHQFKLLGERPILGFGFWRGRLYEVSVAFISRASWEEHARRHAALVASLEKQLRARVQVFPEGFTLPPAKPARADGQPSPPLLAFFTWEQPRLRVRLVSATAGDLPKRPFAGVFTVTYSDPAVLRERKLNPTLFKYMPVGTELERQRRESSRPP